MSKFRESEAAVARCYSKKVLSKIPQITQEKHPYSSLPQQNRKPSGPQLY